MSNIGVIGYFTSCVAFLILSGILKSGWEGRFLGGTLILASVMSAIWSAIAGLYVLNEYPLSITVVWVELLRDAAWLGFLFLLLFDRNKDESVKKPIRVFSLLVFLCISVAVVVLIGASLSLYQLPRIVDYDIRIFFCIVLAVVGLLLIEQLFRNATMEQRWSIKYLCLGIGGIFTYDFYLYSDALLLQEISLINWYARGYINVMVVPLIAVAAARNPQWSLDIYVSRQFVFHTTTLVGAGIYLLAMAVGGYYIKYYSGTWGSIAQLTFFFGALLVLVLLMFSGQMRSRVRVFLSKNFFNYRYDYREEWLKFTNNLSVEGDNLHIREYIVKAVADIVDSPGGILWLVKDDGRYTVSAYLNMRVTDPRLDSDNESLSKYLQERQWVIDLAEYRQEVALYEGLRLPDWIEDVSQAWIIVPLLHQTQLYGFILLARPRAAIRLNWEIRDLLKTAGRQASNYLALLDANESLVDARQFEAFNRLSAYLVHDLKNITAQLSLVVKNASRYKDNREFIDDAFGTVDNTVKKMNKMLAQLKKGRDTIMDLSRINLYELISKVTEHRKAELPAPRFESKTKESYVIADHDKLAEVIGHIVQNAQEASENNGVVKVSLKNEDNMAVIEIEDNGSGMDSNFIQNRLFRPFDTTKGNAGMGIGVYESRELVNSMGGHMSVESEIGKGTLFRIHLKLDSESLDTDTGDVFRLNQSPNATN